MTTAAAEDIIIKEATGDLQFPWKLHSLLDHAKSVGKAHIISWASDGKGFRVYDRKAFEKELMPKFFTTSKFKSFQRSLNLWGFKSVPAGPERGVRFHKSFVRGKPDLCLTMTRTKKLNVFSPSNNSPQNSTTASVSSTNNGQGDSAVSPRSVAECDLYPPNTTIGGGGYTAPSVPVPDASSVVLVAAAVAIAAASGRLTTSPLTATNTHSGTVNLRSALANITSRPMPPPAIYTNHIGTIDTGALLLDHLGGLSSGTTRLQHPAPAITARTRRNPNFANVVQLFGAAYAINATQLIGGNAPPPALLQLLQQPSILR